MKTRTQVHPGDVLHIPYDWGDPARCAHYLVVNQALLVRLTDRGFLIPGPASLDVMNLANLNPYSAVHFDAECETYDASCPDRRYVFVP